MKRVVIIICVLFAVGSMKVNAQQDAQFSQYMFNGLYINPAYAGYRQQWNVNMFYRKQWVGFPGSPKTFSLAADGTANDDRVGLGIQVGNDKLGAQDKTFFYGDYAYRIPMDEYDNKSLALGIGAGFIQQRLNVDALHANDQYDPSILNAQRTSILPDASFGIYYNSDHFYTGLSADNLLTNIFEKNQVFKTVIPLKMHMYFTMGGLIPISDQLQFKPSILVKEDFAGPTSLDLNAFMLFDQTLWIGASYRTAVMNSNKQNLNSSLTKSGAAVGMIEVFVNDKLRIGYAYDQTINGTAANRYSTHELSLNYLFANQRVRMLSPRYF